MLVKRSHVCVRPLMEGGARVGLLVKRGCVWGRPDDEEDGSCGEGATVSASWLVSNVKSEAIANRGFPANHPLIAPLVAEITSRTPHRWSPRI